VIHEFQRRYARSFILQNASLRRPIEINLTEYCEERQDTRLCTTQVVIAALNEEKGIGLTISEPQEKLNSPHILVVDGHSSDRTMEIAKNLGADTALQDGRGKGDAISKALELTKPGTDYIVLTDADFTYPVDEVPKMIEILERNPKVGMVCGNRFTNELNSQVLQDRFFIGNRLLAFAHYLLNGVDLQDPLTGLRVIRAGILKDWSVRSEGFDIEVELNSLVQKKGYKTIEVPIGYRERLGQKKLKMKHGISIFKRIMTEIISN
jgi:glycosyltransferase involved in cell wall biosynthesis